MSDSESQNSANSQAEKESGAEADAENIVREPVNYIPSKHIQRSLLVNEDSILNGVHHLFAPAIVPEINGKGQKGDFVSGEFKQPQVSPDQIVLPKETMIIDLIHYIETALQDPSLSSKDRWRLYLQLQNAKKLDQMRKRAYAKPMPLVEAGKYDLKYDIKEGWHPMSESERKQERAQMMQLLQLLRNTKTKEPEVLHQQSTKQDDLVKDKIESPSNQEIGKKLQPIPKESVIWSTISSDISEPESKGSVKSVSEKLTAEEQPAEEPLAESEPIQDDEQEQEPIPAQLDDEKQEIVEDNPMKLATQVNESEAIRHTSSQDDTQAEQYEVASSQDRSQTYQKEIEDQSQEPEQSPEQDQKANKIIGEASEKLETPSRSARDQAKPDTNKPVESKPAAVEPEQTQKPEKPQPVTKNQTDQKPKAEAKQVASPKQAVAAQPVKPKQAEKKKEPEPKKMRETDQNKPKETVQKQATKKTVKAKQINKVSTLAIAEMPKASLPNQEDLDDGVSWRSSTEHVSSQPHSRSVVQLQEEDILPYMSPPIAEHAIQQKSKSPTVDGSPIGSRHALQIEQLEQFEAEYEILIKEERSNHLKEENTIYLGSDMSELQEDQNAEVLHPQIEIATQRQLQPQLSSPLLHDKGASRRKFHQMTEKKLVRENSVSKELVRMSVYKKLQDGSVSRNSPLSPKSPQEDLTLFDGKRLTNDEISRQIAEMDLVDRQQLYKHVEVDSDDEAPRIPLIVREQEAWVKEAFLENFKAQVVYKRAKFRNSLELIYHNLKHNPASLSQQKDRQLFNNVQINFPAIADTNRSSGEQINTLLDAMKSPSSPFQSVQQPKIFLQSSLPPIGETGLLMFDSEFECGNLEVALTEECPDVSVQQYRLIVQQDYNSKGHQNWFNFTATNFVPGRIYRFFVGPLSRQASSFQQGMLPWVGAQQSDFYELNENIAPILVSQVKYTTVYGERDRKETNFLEFTILSNKLSKSDVLQFAASQPYGYSRLQKTIEHIAQPKESNVNVKLGTLCQSLGGVDVPLVVVTSKSSQVVISAYRKPVIVICSRAHPGDSPASLIVEEIMRQFANADQDESLNKLLALVEVHILPMLNPDGVIVGNSQANLGGVDLDRKWGSGSSAEICPEVHYFQEYLSRLGGRKLMFIEIQCSQKSNGISIISSSPHLDIKDQVDIERWILARALSTALKSKSNLLNSQADKHITIDQDAQLGKQHSARSVCFHELEAEISLTVHASFFRYILTDRSYKTFEMKDYFEAARDLLKGVCRVVFMKQSIKSQGTSLRQILNRDRKPTASIKQSAKNNIDQESRSLIEELLSLAKFAAKRETEPQEPINKKIGSQQRHIQILPSSHHLRQGNQTVLNKRNPAGISIVTGQLDFGSYTLKANSPQCQEDQTEEISSAQHLMGQSMGQSSEQNEALNIKLKSNYSFALNQLADAIINEKDENWKAAKSMDSQSGAFNNTKKSSSASSSHQDAAFETVVAKRIQKALQQESNRNSTHHESQRRYESALQRNVSVNSLAGLARNNSVLSIRNPPTLNQKAALIITNEVAKNHDETMLELLGLKPSRRSLPGVSTQSNKTPFKLNSEHKSKIQPIKLFDRATQPSQQPTNGAPTTFLNWHVQSARKHSIPQTNIDDLQETLLMLPRQRNLVSSLRKQQQRLFNLQAQTRVNPKIQSLITEKLALTALRGRNQLRAHSFQQDITTSPFNLRSQVRIEQPSIQKHRDGLHRQMLQIPSMPLLPQRINDAYERSDAQTRETKHKPSQSSSDPSAMKLESKGREHSRQRAASQLVAHLPALIDRNRIQVPKKVVEYRNLVRKDPGTSLLLTLVQQQLSHRPMESAGNEQRQAIDELLQEMTPIKSKGQQSSLMSDYHTQVLKSNSSQDMLEEIQTRIASGVDKYYRVEQDIQPKTNRKTKQLGMLAQPKNIDSALLIRQPIKRNSKERAEGSKQTKVIRLKKQ